MRNVEPFVSVAEAGSFRGAAKRLGVSPAAVSKAVARLEDELGVRLFDRTSRRVVLTPEGRSLLPHARRSLDHLRAGLDEVARLRGTVDGVLRLSLPFLLGPSIVRRLPELQARHPRLSFAVQLTDRAVDLAAEDIDVAIRIGQLGPHDDLVAHPLGRLRWATAASPTYLGEHGVPSSTKELDHHRCGVFVTPSGSPAPFRFASGDRAVPAAFAVDQGEMLVEAGIAGLCIVQAFRWRLADALRTGALVEVLPHEATDGPPMSAVTLPGRRRIPRVRAFLDFVRDRLGDERGGATTRTGDSWGLGAGSSAPRGAGDPGTSSARSAGGSGP